MFNNSSTLDSFEYESGKGIAYADKTNGFADTNEIDELDLADVLFGGIKYSNFSKQPIENLIDFANRTDTANILSRNQGELRNELSNLSRDDQLEIAHWLLTTVIGESNKNGADNGIMFSTQFKPSLWADLSPVERSQEFRTWIANLPEQSVSLPDEAFDRGSIYE